MFLVLRFFGPYRFTFHFYFSFYRFSSYLCHCFHANIGLTLGYAFLTHIFQDCHASSLVEANFLQCLKLYFDLQSVKMESKIGTCSFFFQGKELRVPEKDEGPMDVEIFKSKVLILTHNLDEWSARLKTAYLLKNGKSIERGVDAKRKVGLKKCC